jgi:hypothetical protein
VWQDTNYFVDVVFTTETAPVDSTTSLATAESAEPSSAKPLLTLRPVDGGVHYYGKFRDSLPSTPEYFPLGVWFESVTIASEAALDKAAGINLYVELTSNSDLSLIEAHGMHALPSAKVRSPSVAGYVTSDEVDMWAGPGSAAWTGNSPGAGAICQPATAKCGYTIMQSLSDAVPAGSLRYANYGKGVAFWATDTEAARFVNDFQDVVSVDTYWFTDPNICGPSEGGAMFAGSQRALTSQECRRAANYGATVERVRSLVTPRGSKPVWAFIEIGHPFSESDAPTIRADEIAAATWSSIIHGARGIIYFNHSFGGTCKSQHLLRDACGALVRPQVTVLNQRISQLAPVLNSPFVDGLVTTTDKIDVAAKIHEGQFYVLAASTYQESQRATLSLVCGAATRAEVVGENRSVNITEGRLVDEFASGTSVHIYQIVGGTTCGLK